MKFFVFIHYHIKKLNSNKLTPSKKMSATNSLWKYLLCKTLSYANICKKIFFVLIFQFVFQVRQNNVTFSEERRESKKFGNHSAVSFYFKNLRIYAILFDETMFIDSFNCTIISTICSFKIVPHVFINEENVIKN